eukprot:TRINITY_DN19139_c0_g1_i3.p1 TRINITY_DN19139_c0_g1~~TRINITY_DN19139_c0_g1_i3.p1  ORF type:complete len:158 (+),score=27.39 TRINITY_DN19139_c0_g1_i3:220-693(+)
MSAGSVQQGQDMRSPCRHLVLRAAHCALNLAQATGTEAEAILSDPDRLVEAVQESKKVKASEHPKYVKYFKMMKVGVPMGAAAADDSGSSQEATVSSLPKGMEPCCDGRRAAVSPGQVAKHSPSLEDGSGSGVATVKPEALGGSEAVHPPGSGPGCE